ncbi:MAG: C40 family peptidase [Propionibacteriaceae bacterium]|nr:C40 family peptidase [Propionibacteriaceae bacterium]
MKRSLPLLLAALLGMTLGLVPLSAQANSSAADNKVYAQPGDHLVNGRYWKTACDKYSSSVVRCKTSIWGTKVVKSGNNYSTSNGWVFNTLTYLPSSRASWAGNPLAKNGSWKASDGRQWRTECDTAVTGRNGCRSYASTTMIEAKASGGRYTYKKVTKEVINNIVQFSSSPSTSVTSIPAKAPALAGVPVEGGAGAAGASSSAAKTAVAAALSKVGSRYVHATAGPNTFDCSGLTSFAYAKAGIKLPRQSGSQFSSGTKVSKSNLKPGDLVFYYSPISHVGIYIGDGKIVHAANPRSGVNTTKLDSMPFAGAVRLSS